MGIIGINKTNCKVCNILLYQNKNSELCNSYINTNYCKLCYNEKRKHTQSYKNQRKREKMLSEEVKEKVKKLYSQGNKVQNIYNNYEEYGLEKFKCSKNFLYSFVKTLDKPEKQPKPIKVKVTSNKKRGRPVGSFKVENSKYRLKQLQKLDEIKIEEKSDN